MLRGAIDPKESPVYEYVKFIGNFKSLNNGMSLALLWGISEEVFFFDILFSKQAYMYRYKLALNLC